MICYCWRGGTWTWKEEAGHQECAFQRASTLPCTALYFLAPTNTGFPLPRLPSWSTAPQAQKQQNQLGMDWALKWGEAPSISSLNCLSRGFATSLTNMAWAWARQQIWPQFPALAHTIHHRGILVSQQMQHLRYCYTFNIYHLGYSSYLLRGSES